MRPFEVRAGGDFWKSLDALCGKCDHEQFVEIIMAVRDCMRELERLGRVKETGWDGHRLARCPFGDGNHFEFRIRNDDVLVVYYKRERKRVIRMVGVYDHDSIPS